VIIRQGRKNPRNLYVQEGDEPADADVSIGYIRLPAVAAWMVERVNFSAAGAPMQKAVEKELKGDAGEDETSSR
jgi:hypothetical protein